MAFLSWRDEYRVGVEHVDQEHRYLFGLINEFHDSHRGGADRNVLQRILNQLVQYAEQHFRHEEDTMRANEYPLLDDHCALHEELYMQVYRLSADLEANSLRVDMDTHRFLRNWLVKHIITEDLQFADHYTRRTKRESAADS